MGIPLWGGLPVVALLLDPLPSFVKILSHISVDMAKVAPVLSLALLSHPFPLFCF
jgi:hypothetical protein